jgi:hypothetical protein
MRKKVPSYELRVRIALSGVGFVGDLSENYDCLYIGLNLLGVHIFRELLPERDGSGDDTIPMHTYLKSKACTHGNSTCPTVSSTVVHTCPGHQPNFRRWRSRVLVGHYAMNLIREFMYERPYQ